VPDAWAAFLAQCQSTAAARPDPADAIMLYQMIVGAWPPDLDQEDEAGRAAFAERLAGWQQKALREAKLRTDWTAPNASYETTARNFLFRLFARDSAFLPIAHSFIDLIAPAGAVNGLAQTVLKMTVPGMPDFFQGTEFWDFSLVDPDNRRPVDYASRLDALAAAAPPVEYGKTWRSGRVKQAVIHRVLGFRQRSPALFAQGDYSPLPVKGKLEGLIVAFTRSLAGSIMIVVVPRLAHQLLAADGGIMLDKQHLRGSALALPEQLHGRRFRSVLSDADPTPAGPELPLQSLLGDFPVAVYHAVDSA